MNPTHTHPAAPPSVHPRRTWSPALWLALAALPCQAATISWDGGGDGTSWNDPANWSGDTLPGPADTAVLNLGSEPQVTLSGSPVTVAALDCREHLTVTSSSLTVTGTCAFRTHRLRLDNATLTAPLVEVIGGETTVAGGAIAGVARLSGGRLEFLNAASTPGEYQLRGAGTLAGNIPAGVTVSVQGTTSEGAAQWTASAPWSNAGTLRLTTVSNDLGDRGAYLNTGELLTILPGGRLEALAGLGDPRVLLGSIRNEGTLAVEANVTLIQRTADTNPPRLTLAAGEVDAAGSVLVENGRIQFLGGTITGIVRGASCTFEIGPGITTPATLRAAGGASRFLGNASPDVTLHVEGSVPWGYARLLVETVAQNAGRILLESTSNNLSDQTCALEITGDGVLHNLASGRINATPGTGDGRVITGHLRNAGLIDADANSPLEFRGRLDTLAGRHSGPVRILASDLSFSGAPAESVEFLLYGGANRLLSDVPANTVLRIAGTTTYGLARLTLPQGLANHGTLRLTCDSRDLSDRSSHLVVSEGTLTNSPDGRIEALAVNGNARRLTGNVLNLGTVHVEDDMTLSLDGPATTFRQAAGALAPSGAFLKDGGRFELAGGQLGPVVRLINGTVTTEPSANLAGTLRLVGANTLERHSSPQTTLWIEGTVPWGTARLRVASNITAEGPLHLESSSNNLADQSCFLDIDAAARLRLAASARITVGPGTGDGRFVNGPLVNAGRIEVAPGAAAEYRGPLESAGGLFSGSFRILGSQITCSAAPTEPTELLLHGTGNQLLSDVPANTLLRIAGNTTYGYARLTLPQGVANAGVLRLSTDSNDLGDRSTELNIASGTLTNLPAGRIEVLAAAGDARHLIGSVLNLGTVAVEDGIALQVAGTGIVFRQAGGELALTGEFYQAGGRFELTGGQLGPVVRVHNGTIATEGSATQGGTLRLVGAESVLARHASTPTTLWVEGTTQWGLARLRVPAPATSSGTLRLETSSNDLGDRSSLLAIADGATLTNEPTGRLVVAAGAGDSRSVTGHLWSRGSIEVGAGAALEFTGRLELDGGSIAGDLRVLGSRLTTLRPASAPSVVPLFGPGNELLSDVEAGYTLWIRGTGQYGYGRLVSNQGLTSRGILRLECTQNDLGDRGVTLDVLNGPLVIAPQGRLESLAGQGDGRVINAELLNQGTVEIGIATSLGRAGAAHRSDGGVLLGNAVLTLAGNSFELGPDGSLAGTGTLDARTLAFRPRGTIRPGASPGILTVRGSFPAESGTLLDLEAAGTEPGTQLDQLLIDGTAQLAGRLRLLLRDGYTPAEGDTLPVLGFTTAAGVFDRLELPALSEGLGWLPEATATQLRLRVVSSAVATSTPPAIVTQPAPTTVVRGRTATFRTLANGSLPLSFRWQRNGNDLDGGTNGTLTLPAVQPAQEGQYRVIISNNAGSVTSAPAALVVLPAVGTLIAATNAPASVLPSIGGDGVEVRVYNEIGGGPAPTFAQLEGLAPTGTTPSPVIDFPRPGSTIGVGTSFNTFFADTTTPPAALSAVAARNFILDHDFLLRVERSADLHPDTPEIDIDLGVGSDDGFRLRIGGIELGAAGDRGFTYSWFTASFEAEGLYPVRLLFSANAVGASGLEFSWRTATGGQQIVPQSALYRSLLLGDRLVDFDSLPADTRLTDQYAGAGLRFSTLSGDPRITDARPDRLVPVSPGNVFADPTQPATVAPSFELSFVVPGSAFPASTTFLSLYVIDAETGGLRIEGFDPSGNRFFDREFHGGAASREPVLLSAPQIARVRLTQLDPADTVAIDHITFITPTPLNRPPVLNPIPDLAGNEGAPLAFQASASDPDAGQSVRFALRAGAPSGAVIDPVSGQFSWATSEQDGPGDYSVTVVVTDDGQPPLSVEQVVHLRVNELNAAPTLAALPPLWVSAEGPLQYTLQAFDPDLPVQPLSFRLLPGAPAGLGINPDTGVLSWTVAGTFPAGTYAAEVEVSDNGTPALTAVRPVSITVDHAGPRVLSATPSGVAPGAVREVVLQFDRALLPASISTADVTLTGPAGAIAVQRVSLPAPDRIQVHFSEQRLNGTYALSAGPEILSLARARMDQDADGTGGEPAQDVFTASFDVRLPDLAVVSLTSPATGAPGEPVPLVWGVTNRGIAPARAPWFESVRLSPDDAVGGDQVVLDLRITNDLPAGTGLVRTQWVTLPLTGLAGSLRFVLVADANGSVDEESESNNALVASSPILVAPGLSLQLARNDVPEGAPAFQAILRRNGPLDQPLTATLEATPANQVDLPPSVTVPAGQASVTFNLSARNDGVVDGDTNVGIVARAAGYHDGSASLVVRDIHIPLLRLTLVTNRTPEGGVVGATVTREPLTAGALEVRLSSENPAQLRVPSSLTLAAGQASASFNIEAVDDPDIERTASFLVTAAADGFTPANAALDIDDNDAPIVTLSIAPATFSEGAGPTAAIATLTRQPASTLPLRVALGSSLPAAAQVPAFITLPAEAASVTFPVSATDDTVADGPQSSTVTALWIDAPTGQPFGIAAQATVTVTDDDAPALFVRIERDAVPEGLSPVTVARIRGNQETLSPVTVTLVSSLPGELTAPATVLLPSGDAEVTVPLASIDDGVADGSRTVTLTASAPGFLPGSDEVIVTDVNLPDLVIERLEGPASGLTDAPFQVTYREVNRGLAPATGRWSQSIYLSTDALPGDDQLLGTVGFEGTIAPGLFLERTLQFNLPSAPGTYHLIAVSDPANAVPELVEGNNVTVAATPITVTAAYVATVATDITLAPAGTVVPLAGRATRAGGTQPAAFEPVHIHVLRGDTRRVILALADADGRFTATFNPLPGEAGQYRIGAAHPGLPEAPVQDTFILSGMRFEPRTGALTFNGPGVRRDGFSLQNLSSVPVTGLTVTAGGLPDWCDLVPAVPATLPGDGLVTVEVTATNRRETAGYAEAWIEVRAEGGLLARLPLTVRVQPLVPRLVAEPGRIEAGMLRGDQTLLSLRIRNEGGATSGPVSVLLPPFDWFAVASAQPLPALPPGGEAEVTLRLSPPADLPLGRYDGNLVLSAANAATSVPFSLLALSEATGTLAISTVDEFTYYAAGNPPLSNAVVTVTDELTRIPAATGRTDATGRVRFENLREGYYRVRATADGHSGNESVLLVPAGQTTDQTIFLARNTVEYRWTVTPTEIEDRTRITVEAVFETVVPAPVVVVEPTVIDFADFASDVSQVEFKITNHGLIAANDVRLQLPSPDGWVLEPLVEDLGDLPARSSLTVPVVVRRITREPRGGAAPHAESGGCRVGAVLYALICGPFGNNYRIEIAYHNDGSGCPAGGGGGGYASGGGGGGGAWTPPRPVSFDYTCGPGPCAREVAKWAFDCATSILPLNNWFSCAKGTYDCLKAAAEGANQSTAVNCLSAISDCAEALGKNINPLIGGAIDLLSCADGMRSVAECLEKAKKEKESQGRGAGLAAWTDYDIPADLVPHFETVERRLHAFANHLAVHKAFIGNPAWFHRGMDESFSAWFTRFKTAAAKGTPLDERIDLAERLSLTDGPIPVGLSKEQVALFLDRWNRTLNYYGQGVFNRAQVPQGANPDFIALDEILAASKVSRDAEVATEAAGFSDPASALKDAAVKWKQAIEASGLLRFDYAKSPTVRAATPAANGSDAGICARVRLRIEQEAVISRDAFEARLEVENRQDTPLRDVRIDLVIRDAAGNPANTRFGIRPPQVTGFGAIDGTGQLAGQSMGTVLWTLIPSSEAAPDGPVSYSVSGTLRYVEEGIEVILPLAPATIDVLPNASLAVKYFHQRDVLADDPFTDDVVEPSVPYSLAVLVENRGRGEARNVRIASAQPRIVENEKGLLIDFQIIGTEVAGQSLSPSLTVNLGTIAPGQSAIGRWLLRSSLQGQFIEYSATFEHLDGLGDPRLSLIEGVEIHELIRIVDAGDADPRMDFLANDLADENFLPDTLHLSSGGIVPVTPLTQGTVGGTPGPGQLEVTLTANTGPGWFYLRIPDPSAGALKLTAIRRANGSIVPAANFWVSDRTFIANSRRPIYEHRLHLLDLAQPATGGLYTLVYTANPPADTTAPASSVASLPAASRARIPVSWSGTDNPGGSGVATYDVLVAKDRGPFLPWLRNVTATSATYLGEPGHVYAFYSVATDNAGNREADPGSAQASTTTSLTNQPPRVASPDPVQLPEGDTLRLVLSASDPDEPFDQLTYRLGPGAPAGVRLDARTGQLVWPTSEALGPGVHRITVEVSDDGLPPLAVTGEVQVTVTEINAAPTLAAIPDQLVNEGEELTFDAVASDPDLPANTLRFRLLGTPPAGATLDPVTGRFRWKPAPDQGGRPHILGISVDDNGTPVLTATRYVTVVVNDVLPDFEFVVGRAWVRAGDIGVVPLVLDSLQPLLDVRLELDVLDPPAAAPALAPLAPTVTASSLQSLNPGRHRIEFTASRTAPFSGRLTLGELRFDTDADAPSAYIRFRAEAIVANRPAGGSEARGHATNGRLVILGSQPVLEAETDGSVQLLRLFAEPGRTCRIERQSALDPLAPWVPVRTLVPSSVETTLGDLDLEGYYRAVYLGTAQPVLAIERQPDGSLLLKAAGPIAGSWLLEQTDAWSPSGAWTEVGPADLGGPLWSRSIPAPDAASRWFRLRRLP